LTFSPPRRSRFGPGGRTRFSLRLNRFGRAALRKFLQSTGQPLVIHLCLQLNDGLHSPVLAQQDIVLLPKGH